MQGVFKQRMKGARASTNIEDRRGEVLPAGTAPGDSVGARANVVDLNDPIPVGRRPRTSVSPEKARYDLKRGILASKGRYSPYITLSVSKEPVDLTRLPKRSGTARGRRRG